MAMIGPQEFMIRRGGGLAARWDRLVTNVAGGGMRFD